MASNTKTMTAAMIVLLAQEGKLSLNDPVSKYALMLKVLDQIYVRSPFR